MDCEIRVPGVNDGAAGNGAPSRTKVGPVSSFLKDSDHYYRAVWKHVKGCSRCDPAEVLRGFLANRDVRHRGETTTLLIEMAEKYRRAMPDRVPAELVREFVVRGVCSWNAFEDRVGSLSAEEIVRAHDMYLIAWKKEILESVKKEKRGRSRMVRRWPFCRGQGEVGWLNDKDHSHLGMKVPERTARAAAMSRDEAMAAGGWDLAVWLITRHDRMTAMEDPDVKYVLAFDMMEEVMED